jgi:hypothetical protein
MDCKEVSCNTLTCISMDHKNSTVDLENAVMIFNRNFRLPRFQASRHMKIIRLSTLHTLRLYPQETFLVLISVRG